MSDLDSLFYTSGLRGFTASFPVPVAKLDERLGTRPGVYRDPGYTVDPVEWNNAQWSKSWYSEQAVTANVKAAVVRVSVP